MMTDKPKRKYLGMSTAQWELDDIEAGIINPEPATDPQTLRDVAEALRSTGIKQSEIPARMAGAGPGPFKNAADMLAAIFKKGSKS